MKASVSSLRNARLISKVFEPVRDRLQLVERFFDQEMEKALPKVREVGGYVLGSGGKRLRPALVLLVSRMLGYRGDRDIRYGAVVELIHTATLIHDDIIDESDLRRGRPTANRKWGDETAVLVGDWLYSRSMDLCLEYGDVAVMRVLNAATLRMTEGEILSAHWRGNVEIDEATYMDITRRKTAELFGAASSIPALFDPSTFRFEEALFRFGANLGLCFQLVDDVLDFTADQKELGKPVMADLREGRATLPILLLLDCVDPGTRESIAAVARDRRFDAVTEAEVLDLIKKHRVLKEVHRRAEVYAEKAVEVSRFLPEGREREALVGATRLLLDRRY